MRVIRGNKHTHITKERKRARNRVYVYHTPDEDTPVCSAEYVSDDGDIYNWNSLLDTGATKSVISANLFNKWGIQLLNRKPRPMYSVTGERMTLKGMAYIYVKMKNSMPHKCVTFLVCEDTTDDIIIGFSDLKRLGM